MTTVFTVLDEPDWKYSDRSLGSSTKPQIDSLQHVTRKRETRSEILPPIQDCYLDFEDVLFEASARGTRSATRIEA
jgi:hypothetical protein